MHIKTTAPRSHPSTILKCKVYNPVISLIKILQEILNGDSNLLIQGVAVEMKTPELHVVISLFLTFTF